jgi:hypothetical protein
MSDRIPQSRWWREPLLHFIVLGAALFSVDYLLTGGDDDGRTIVVDAEVDAEARRIFAEARGREPDAGELEALRQVWLDNEVLYREGLELRLDEGDTTIRERVIFKALSVINAGLEAPSHDEAELRAWFEENRGRYDEPARFDFQEAVLAGDPTPEALQEFVADLNAGAPEATAEASLRVFNGRPIDNLVHSYGEDFVAVLETTMPGEWLVLPSREGPRAIRLDAATAPRPASFEDLFGVVRQDWVDTVMSEQRTAAVRALASKYEVEIAPAATP